MGILKTALRAVTWWNGQTFNTQIYTWLKGVKVGEDAQGNIYYRDRQDRRRWVIFDGECEASRVGADWHGWLHHTFKDPPTMVPLHRKDWEKPHEENLTGTIMAYTPAGSIRKAKPLERRDYEAWKPE